MNTLQEEIIYVHENQRKGIVRDREFMFDVVCSATNTYTNLALFWNDYVKNKELSNSEKDWAFNDLYLLALLHIDEVEWEELKKMNRNEICGDNRFEIIKKAKEDLLKCTNIESSKEEMDVLDDFLFRCWQMGWLDKYESISETLADDVKYKEKEEE